MTNLMNSSEEDRVIGTTIDEGELSDNDDTVFIPLAIRSDEKQLKLISRNQDNGYIKLKTEVKS